MGDQAVSTWVGLREFEDADGAKWCAGVKARSGKDFKGRFYFVARPMGDSDSHPESDELVLGDVRWNSEDTARRTLRTMSGVELRRRLRSARGRFRGGD